MVRNKKKFLYLFLVWHGDWVLDIKTLLSTYSAVLYWSNNAFAKRDAELGNLFAEFVNAGGGAIVMCFGKIRLFFYDSFIRMLRMSTFRKLAIWRIRSDYPCAIHDWQRNSRQNSRSNTSYNERRNKFSRTCRRRKY
jgi:hypothetical protein